MQRLKNILARLKSVLMCIVIAPTLFDAAMSGAATANVSYYEVRKKAAHDMAEAARILGYAEDSDIIIAAGKEWEEADKQARAHKELEAAPEPIVAASYSDDDLDLLAKIIYAEAGSTWIPDWVQLAVGSVVLNRVNSSSYPDNLYDVIYQPGQYSPTWNGAINNTPDERTYENAQYLLENGSTLPAGVIGQSQVAYGEIYTSYYDSILDTTTYFCY